MEKHFVIFYSPGTIVSETDDLPIDSWDIDKAVELSYSVKQRYGATPYGFRFITKVRTEDELDSKEVTRSSMYYLGGTVYTLEQIKAKNNPKDSILISNMEYNNWDKIVINNNSYSWAMPLHKNDIVLSYNINKKKG